MKKIKTILVLAGMALIIASFFVNAEAKTKDVMITKGGYTYILRNGKPRTGWITYKGNRYYAHKTKSRMYPKGSICKNTYRVKNGKMYYFGSDGKKQTKSSRYITINKRSTSVHYIHAPGMIRRYRYNCNRRRFQYLDDNGKWVNDGSKGWPEGMIDWQE